MTFLENTYQKFESKITIFLEASNWQWRVVVVSGMMMLLSFFNNTMPFDDFKLYYEEVIVKRDEFFLYKVTRDRAKNLTEHRVYLEPASNNRVFRLTLPVIVKVLHIRHVSIFIYGLQLVLGVLLYFLLTRFLFQLLNDKVATFLSMIALSCIYFGSAFFIENCGYGDFYTFFFLFLGMYFRNPLIIFASIFAATWCDERAAVASGLVFLWWWISPTIKDNRKISFIPSWQMITVALGVIAYGGLRLYLMKYVGMSATYKEGEFMQMIHDSWRSFGFKFTWVLEGFWLVMLLAFGILYSNKEYQKLILVAGGTLAMVFLGMTTYDSTRSGSYVFPMIFLGLMIVQTQLSNRQLRIVLTLVALLCFLHPLATKTRGVGYFLM
ncbi:hypothetical protein [Emticicia agri]|uniref:Glycosyltransferase RgtA/B/C/D-like domain-containing protein n=1 Tax=Emticicia agri TaxID=2492393 RepID=A0A4Q5LR13_9BACT|nr:hypothetical protein [Emticicia agri]RYU91857.1 hypothetical protein EWM59_26400 [Emticicia agri]